jgi:uncharacterized protein YwgA
MDRRQITGLLVLKELGIELTLKTFDNRLAVQKAVYLAQAAGLNLGYYYGWYLRGPYCAAVADDVFFALNDPVGMQDAERRYTLDDESKKETSRLRSFFHQDRTTSSPKSQKAVNVGDLARRLELLASVHFLVARKQVNGHDPKEIWRRLRKFNKNFSEQEVKTALTQLHGQRLLQSPRH